MINNNKFKKNLMIVVSPLKIGGVDLVAINLQTHINKDKYNVIYYLNGEDIGPMEDYVLKTGATIFHRPKNVGKSYIKQYLYLKKFMIENNIDIVHSHLMFYSGLVMRAAAKVGVKKRVPHSHMTNPCIQRSALKNFLFIFYHFIMKNFLIKYGTDIIACGPEAGDYLYGKNVFEKRGIILHNGIELNKYFYSNETRNLLRKSQNLNDSIVIGHVGRLNFVKNHTFLLDVFYEIYKINNNAILLIVGDGEQKQNIINKADKLGILDKVIITGIRHDVEKLLQAMDIMIFPSLYEGLPLTLIEAQASKLPCLISDTVSKSAKYNENVDYMSLKQSPKEWAKKALYMIKNDRNSINISNLCKDYDINSVALKLEEIYDNI